MGQHFQALLIGASLISVVLARTVRVLASPDIPITSFSCADRPIGYYADVENNCQTYHMCGEKGEMYSYACPNTTLFHQRMLICAHWYQVNCSRSADDYSANLLIGQRDKPFVDDITANSLNGIQTGESLQKLGNLAARDGKSFVSQKSPIDYVQPTQVTYSSQVPHQDLLEAPSGSFFQDRGSRTTQRIPSAETRPAFFDQRFENLQASTPSRTTSSVTEPTGAVFRPTNVSFRSTIETPNSELAALARTAPMTSAAQPASFGRTESSDFFRSSSASPPETVTTTGAPLADKPSLELLPPLDTSIEETNTIELHLHDPRRVLYIPRDGGPSLQTKDEPIVVSINLTGRSRFRPQSPLSNTLSRSSQSLSRTRVAVDCPRCHPMFVIDRTNCSPCLLLIS
ncbi:Hypothetical protein NTJ_14767 [Nesidiocoris tenuis]|uniref:Chitin-binding type-2 domain-containing protein n=1 Tax=Nesidiocoris tenuis TaxID=355587 RepID=A0ABN7BCH3_9HEMI|nr:Hypothetical protein NTJ_14767 [Nesidiocoris tenuis]